MITDQATLTYGDIARLLNVHPITVMRARRTLGLDNARIQFGKRGVRFSVAILRKEQPWFSRLEGNR